MRVVALKRFRDKVENVFRNKGDEFEISRERFEELKVNGINAGMGVVVEEVAPLPQPKRKGRMTKADLLAEAEELGIEVPEKATYSELQALVKEAR